MERYTDKYHPNYVPGTYSIYTSALIRYRHQEEIKRYRHLLANIQDDKLRKLTAKKKYQLSDNYNYKFSERRAFEDIPDVKTRYGVILQPQPTNSVNDPLNWTPWRKGIHAFILLLVTSFTAAIANDASAPTDSIQSITGISYDTLNNAAGVLFIAIAFSTWLYSPFDTLLGRKSVILFGMTFAFCGSLWYARMRNNGDSYGSQVFIGFSLGSADAHVQLCLASIFFRHQLGAIITIYNLAYALGTYLGPMIGNFISNSKGFEWVGWSGLIAAGIILIIVILFLEENSFDYTRYTEYLEDVTLKLGFLQHGIISNDESNDRTLQGYDDAPLSYWERIKPFREFKSDNYKKFIMHYFQLLTVPIQCFRLPPVVFSGCICGLQNAILTFYLTTQDTELYGPPFNYSETRVAIMNVSSIIGSSIGCIYAGSLTDYFILWMARKHKGIVQSEYRLYFSFLSGTIGAIGLLMFGIGIERNLNWRVFYVGLGFISYMFSSSNNLAMLYVMDTYRELTLETLVAVAFINNIFGCIFTFACSSWLDNSGTENTYIALAAITLGVMYSSGIFIYYGYSWRKSTHALYVKLVERRNTVH